MDVDAAMHLIRDFGATANEASVFAIIKHTNVCGIAERQRWHQPGRQHLPATRKCFCGVLVCNGTIDAETANAINEIFFEVLIAPDYSEEALTILKSKKNRILLQLHQHLQPGATYRSLLNGVLTQQTDEGNYAEWKEAGGRPATEAERADLVFANLVCKHLKSNAIALVKDKQLVGKGCGQTSRIDALRHAIEKQVSLILALPAQCWQVMLFSRLMMRKNADEAGITAFIQPGGSIRDKDSIAYCEQQGLAMVITGMRHFRH